MEQVEIDQLIVKLCDEQDVKAYKYSDTLGHTGGDYIVDAMIGLLKSPKEDVRYLAARTLSIATKDNAPALPFLFEAIEAPENADKNGGLVEALSGFDLSEQFVPIFKLFLSKNFKVETMAKVMLDFTEFNITPRSIRKAEKHWNHYVHNTPHDELFTLKEIEVNEILEDLKELFPSEEQ